MVHWLVSIPVPQNQTKEQVYSRISAKLTSASVQHSQYEIASLRKGSQDSLYSLMDELTKFDQSIEGATHRSLKSLKDVTDLEKEDDFIPQVILEDVNGPPQKKAVKDYLSAFKWDDKRYILSKELPSTAEKIYKSCVKLDDDLRIKVADYNALKINLTQIERRDTGSIIVRPLDGIVTQENFYESELFQTFYVVVPKFAYRDWLSSYVEIVETYHKESEMAEVLRQKELVERAKEAEKDKRERERERDKEEKISSEERTKREAQRDERDKKDKEDKLQKDAQEKARREKMKQEDKQPPPPVVPDSSILIYEEGEYGVFTCLVLKLLAQDFKKACESFKYKVREFTYDEQRNELSKMEKGNLATKKDEMKRELLGWCQSAFSEIFLNWLHVKVIRVFVESILRYGLPPNFVCFLVRTDAKERQIHKIFREECKDLISDELDEHELIKNDFYPYILIPINTSDPLFRFDLKKK